MEENNKDINVIDNVPMPNGSEPVNNDINPVNEIANVANENGEAPKVEEPVNPTNELEQLAQMAYNKQAPNVDLGNKPIVEQPKEEEIEVVSDDNPKTFNDNSQTIGTIKPDKQKSPMAMLVLFGVLILFILFMPEAVKKFNEYFGTDFNVQDGIYIQDNNDTNTTNNNTNNNTNNTNKNTNTNTNSNSNLKLYSLSETLTINVDKLVLSNFKKSSINNNYYIEYTIKNTDSTDYTFTRKLYLDFYNASDALIDRIIVDSNEVSASSTIQVSSIISKDVYDNGVKVEALFRSGEDYPKTTLTNNTLTCIKDNRTLLFNFKDNKLTDLSDTVNYLKGTDLNTYTNQLMNSKNIINNMDLLDGVNAIITESDTGFITKITVNYNTANYDTLTYKEDYYQKDTLDSTISFELKAKNYTCS